MKRKRKMIADRVELRWFDLIWFHVAMDRDGWMGMMTTHHCIMSWIASSCGTDDFETLFWGRWRGWHGMAWPGTHNNRVSSVHWKSSFLPCGERVWLGRVRSGRPYCTVGGEGSSNAMPAFLVLWPTDPGHIRIRDLILILSPHSCVKITHIGGLECKHNTLSLLLLLFCCGFCNYLLSIYCSLLLRLLEKLFHHLIV